MKHLPDLGAHLENPLIASLAQARDGVYAGDRYTITTGAAYSLSG